MRPRAVGSIVSTIWFSGGVGQNGSVMRWNNLLVLDELAHSSHTVATAEQDNLHPRLPRPSDVPTVTRAMLHQRYGRGLG